jgi:hypothetical protein
MKAAEVATAVADRYQSATNLTPHIYITAASAGTAVIDPPL